MQDALKDNATGQVPAAGAAGRTGAHNDQNRNPFSTGRWLHLRRRSLGVCRAHQPGWRRDHPGGNRGRPTAAGRAMAEGLGRHAIEHRKPGWWATATAMPRNAPSTRRPPPSSSKETGYRRAGGFHGRPLVVGHEQRDHQRGACARSDARPRRQGTTRPRTSACMRSRLEKCHAGWRRACAEGYAVDPNCSQTLYFPGAPGRACRPGPGQSGVLSLTLRGACQRPPRGAGGQPVPAPIAPRSARARSRNGGGKAPASMKASAHPRLARRQVLEQVGKIRDAATR